MPGRNEWSLAGGEGGAQAQDMQERNKHALQDMLTEAQKDRFERFVVMNEEAQAYGREEAFVIGFRCGVELMVEAMGGDDAYLATRPMG